MKECKVCGKEKDEWDFGTVISRKTGIQYTANTCRKCKYVKEKKGQFNRRLERLYDMSSVDWKLILKLQNNKCKLCGREFVGRICTDHDHKTGVVRGLLCLICNNVLKYFDDSVLHDKFIDYAKNADALEELHHAST